MDQILYNRVSDLTAKVRGMAKFIDDLSHTTIKLVELLEARVDRLEEWKKYYTEEHY